MPRSEPGQVFAAGAEMRAKVERKVDALTMLKNDHDEIKELMSQLDAQSDDKSSDKETVFTMLSQKLQLHEALEESIFYPAMKQHPKTKELALEGYDEHEELDEVMLQIKGLDFMDAGWPDKVKAMKEKLEHHIQEEEEELFPKAQQVFSEEELQELGSRMEEQRTMGAMS